MTGGHTYKIGMDYRLEKYPNYVLTNTNGTYTFGTSMTETPSLLNTVTNQGFQWISVRVVPRWAA